MAQGDQLFKTRQQIVAEVIAAWQARIPDVAVSPDTLIRIWSEVFAHTGEGFYNSMQVLNDDAFVQTATLLALQRHGEMYGRPQKLGTVAVGTVRFQGAGGEFIQVGSKVGAQRPGLGDTLEFETTDDATIPNPGAPSAPTAADSGGSGALPAGTFEWAVTFTTAEGETEIGAASNSLVLAASHKGGLTNVPVGGPGTIGRKIYRRKNGGLWQYVATMAENVITIYLDNTADGSLGGNPPDESTAERVTVGAQSVETGSSFNVAPGSITDIVSVDADVNAVTNVAAFVNGTDSEAIEVFRAELQYWIQAPQSGSALDLIAWATSIDGVETASVFKNVDLSGTPALGTVSVRIAGPAGAVPDAPKVAEVLAFLESKDLANITILVGTFDPLTITGAVDVDLAAGYVLADVTPALRAAYVKYVNSVPVGGTVYVAGIYHALFPTPGIVTLEVTTPAADVVAANDEKPTAITTDLTVT